MSEADAAAGLLWLSLTAYAVLAGADFGGGVWDIFASGPRKRAQRQAVARAMGPVWEANHVWLIFMITGLFTTFPVAFSSLGLALYVPMTVALVGIVLRGAAFAFRAHGREAVGPLSPWGIVFGGSSIVAPFFLGTAAAAVASGDIRIAGGNVVSGFGAGWSTPFAIVVGLLAVSLCAYLAAAYLMVETEDEPELQSDFRRRAMVASAVSGMLALLGLWLAYAQAPRVWSDLTGNGLPLLILALINGPIALWGVWRLRPRVARFAVAAQVALVLWAWALGQWPYLVPPDLTIAGAAEPAHRKPSVAALPISAASFQCLEAATASWRPSSSSAYCMCVSRSRSGMPMSSRIRIPISKWSSATARFPIRSSTCPSSTWASARTIRSPVALPASHACCRSSMACGRRPLRSSTSPRPIRMWPRPRLSIFNSSEPLRALRRCCSAESRWPSLRRRSPRSFSTRYTELSSFSIE